jgi:phage tail-like protein
MSKIRALVVVVLLFIVVSIVFSGTVSAVKIGPPPGESPSGAPFQALQEDVTELNKSLADESAGRKAADVAIQDQLDVNTGAIDSFFDVFATVEQHDADVSGLQASIDAEAAAREEGDLRLEGSIEGKYSDLRIDLDSTIDLVEDFVSRLEQIEAAVSGLIASLSDVFVTIEGLDADVSDLQTSIDAEAAAREEGDLRLEGSIRGELGDFEVEFDGRLDTVEDFTYSQEAINTELVSKDLALDERINTETVAGLSCDPGEVAKWNGTAWECSVDEDTDTTLSEAEVDSFVADNGYLTSVGWTDIQGIPQSLDDGDNDTLGALLCSSGEVPQWDGSAWACSSSTQETPPPPQSAPFTLDISPSVGSDLPDTTWDSFSGGGLRFNEPSGVTTGPDQFKNHVRGIAEWDDLVLTGAMTKTRPASQHFFCDQFSTDLGPNVTAISSITVRFPKVPASSGSQSNYKVWQPGQPIYGNVVFKISGISIDMQNWVKDTYQGQDTRKDITINLGPSSNIVATYNLIDAFPTSYELPNNEDSYSYLEVRVNRIDITPSRPYLFQWYKDMQERGDAADVYRDVTVSYDVFDPQGGKIPEMRTINYLDSWLTSYSLSPLDGDEDDVECMETLEIAVGYSEDFLT